MHKDIYYSFYLLTSYFHLLFFNHSDLYHTGPVDGLGKDYWKAQCEKYFQTLSDRMNETKNLICKSCIFDRFSIPTSSDICSLVISY